jgi:hypothetical protein
VREKEQNSEANKPTRKQTKLKRKKKTKKNLKMPYWLTPPCSRIHGCSKLETKMDGTDRVPSPHWPPHHRHRGWSHYFYYYLGFALFHSNSADHFNYILLLLLLFKRNYSKNKGSHNNII